MSLYAGCEKKLVWAWLKCDKYRMREGELWWSLCTASAAHLFVSDRRTTKKMATLKNFTKRFASRNENCRGKRSFLRALCEVRNNKFGSAANAYCDGAERGDR